MDDGARFTPIGLVHGTRKEVRDDLWDAERATIELDAARFDDDALRGLDTFSHVEVLFLMDRVDPEKIERGARHPRNETSWPAVGIFAQRGKNRPNRIGATVCRVLGVRGRFLDVEGLDAVDRTPVLDLKPWVTAFGPRGEVHEPPWMAELMRRYWDAD